MPQAEVLPPVRGRGITDGTVLGLAQFALVAGYLGGALCLLIAARRVRPGVSLGRMLWQSARARLLHKGKGRLGNIDHDTGHCFLAPVHPGLVSDADGKSWLVLLEDGRPLPRPHASHDEVRRIGRGAYSHWNEALYFSTTDNSDPRTNGRVYTFVETTGGSPPVG